MPFECGQYLADHIPNARLIATDLGAHISTAPEWLEWLADFEEFTTGARPAEFIDRVLSTVLFSDIVGSTDRAVDDGRRCVAAAARPPRRDRAPGDRARSAARR